MKIQLLFALAGLLMAADTPTDDAKKDLDKWQGTWVATSGETSGKAFDDATVKSIKFVITGDKYTFAINNENEEGTIKLDSSKSPKAFDVQITEGSSKGKSQQGIYQLEGDTLKICFAGPGKERPTEMSTKEGSDLGMIAFKKER
jgi:uncharacterized protein (TIGR03067 family)